MILTSHMLAGAAVASQTSSIPAAVLLSFCSHYLLDFIPHSEYSIKNIQKKDWKKSSPAGLFGDFFKIFLDFSAGIIFISVLSKNLPLALIGGFAAIMPDGLTFLSFLFPDNKILIIHRKFHDGKMHFWKNKKISSFGKLIAQFLAISVSIFFLLR